MTEKSDVQMSCQDNFQPEYIQYLLCDNCTEYHDPHEYQKPDIPQVTGLDIVWLHELHDHQKTDEPQYKEQSKVKSFRHEHRDCQDGEPEPENNCTDLFLSHQDSVPIDNIPVPVSY